MDSNLKRALILENYMHPFNKGLIENDGYKHFNVNNDSCIDNLNLMLNVKNNIVDDIRFDGEACAISTSSTSIIIKTLLNKNVDEALHIIDEYVKMINEEQYDPDILGEAIVYDEIYKQPNRKKCALLSVRGIKKVLEENKKESQ